MSSTTQITERQRVQISAQFAKTKAQVSDKTRDGREILLGHFLKLRRKVRGRADFVLSTGCMA
jgi:hypothetical protein